MHRWQITALLLLSSLALFAAPAEEPATLQGFSANSSQTGARMGDEIPFRSVHRQSA